MPLLTARLADATGCVHSRYIGGRRSEARRRSIASRALRGIAMASSLCPRDGCGGLAKRDGAFRGTRRLVLRRPRVSREWATAVLRCGVVAIAARQTRNGSDWGAGGREHQPPRRRWSSPPGRSPTTHEGVRANGSGGRRSGGSRRALRRALANSGPACARRGASHPLPRTTCGERPPQRRPPDPSRTPAGWSPPPSDHEVDAGRPAGRAIFNPSGAWRRSPTSASRTARRPP